MHLQSVLPWQDDTAATYAYPLLPDMGYEHASISARFMFCFSFTNKPTALVLVTTNLYLLKNRVQTKL